MTAQFAAGAGDCDRTRLFKPCKRCGLSPCCSSTMIRSAGTSDRLWREIFPSPCGGMSLATGRPEARARPDRARSDRDPFWTGRGPADSAATNATHKGGTGMVADESRVSAHGATGATAVIDIASTDRRSPRHPIETICLPSSTR